MVPFVAEADLSAVLIHVSQLARTVARSPPVRRSRSSSTASTPGRQPW